MFLLAALQLRYFTRNPVEQGSPDQVNGAIVSFYKLKYWVDYIKVSHTTIHVLHGNQKKIFLIFYTLIKKIFDSNNAQAPPPDSAHTGVSVSVLVLALIVPHVPDGGHSGESVWHSISSTGSLLPLSRSRHAPGQTEKQA